MAEYEAKRNPDRCPSHPGAVLYDILAERKPVSPTVAARLGKLLGNGPEIWLRLQAGYDAWHAEREVDVSNIPTIKAA